jgi:hypothetical protein
MAYIITGVYVMIAVAKRQNPNLNIKVGKKQDIRRKQPVIIAGSRLSTGHN